jgi:hypothetical protein
MTDNPLRRELGGLAARMGAKERATRMTPKRFVSNSERMSERLAVRTGVLSATPALLTRIEISSAIDAALWTDSSSVTSMTIGTIRGSSDSNGLLEVAKTLSAPRESNS